MERRTTIHLDGGPDVVGEDEDGGVIDRVVAPPPPPLIVRPRAALRTELVATHDLRADAGTPLAGKGLVEAGASAGLSLHGVMRSSREEPLHQSALRVPEGRVKALALTSAKSVERDREVVDAHLRHEVPPRSASLALLRAKILGKPKSGQNTGVESGHGRHLGSRKRQHHEPNGMEVAGLRVTGVEAESGLTVSPCRDKTRGPAGPEGSRNQKLGRQVTSLVLQR